MSLEKISQQPLFMNLLNPGINKMLDLLEKINEAKLGIVKQLLYDLEDPKLCGIKLASMLKGFCLSIKQIDPKIWEDAQKLENEFENIIVLGKMDIIVTNKIMKYV